MKNNHIFLYKIIRNIVLLFLSVFLFIIANPNPIIKDGVALAGWFIYFPLLLIIYNSSLKTSWLYGGFYGLLSYGFYASWLNAFHPMGLILVVFLYFVIMAAVFTLLKLTVCLFKDKAWFICFLIICSYEYVKTLGFAGFSYGVTAYTQWQNLYFIQIAEITGVFGLNTILIFPSCWLAGFLLYENSLSLRLKISGGIWGIALISAFLFGFIDFRKKTETDKSVKIVAVQSNEDPWLGGIKEYAKNLMTLKNLTDEALEFNSDIDFVLWPETSVVPSVMHQYYKLVDENRFRLIYSLLNYIENKNSVFIIGNSHEELDNKRNTQRYNNALVFEPGVNVIPPEPEMYSKIHLVPFTEHFPYKNYFPGLYARLLNGDTHMWTPGNDYVVFNKKGLSFSTPICFEDTFGDDCRNFVKNGARCFLNMSNDAWSKSSTCQKQHLAMAVMRSVENKIPTVRSTVSGQTCIIDSDGRITKMLPEFSEGFLVGDIPVLADDFSISVYTKYGDIAGKAVIILTCLLLIIQIINVIIKNKIKK